MPAFWGAFSRNLVLRSGGFIRDEGAQITLIGCIWGKKAPNLVKLGAFFRKWYTDGWEVRQKIGIEIVRFSRSGRHIHILFW